MWGLRCRVQNSGFGVQGSGFRVQGSGFRVQDAGYRVQGSGCRVQGSGFRGTSSAISVAVVLRVENFITKGNYIKTFLAQFTTVSVQIIDFYNYFVIFAAELSARRWKPMAGSGLRVPKLCGKLCGSVWF